MTGQITRLLDAHDSGDPAAMEELAYIIYPQVKAMARKRLKGRSALSASTLVNETFVKLMGKGQLRSQDRTQFFGLVATVMRGVIIDDARMADAAKRARQDVTYKDEQTPSEQPDRVEFLLDVDEALQKLEAEDERLVRVFECRFFAGYTIEETATAMDIPRRTADRLWAKAKAKMATLVGGP